MPVRFGKEIQELPRRYEDLEEILRKRHMVELDNLKLEIREYEEPLAELKASLDLESKANRIYFQ